MITHKSTGWSSSAFEEKKAFSFIFFYMYEIASQNLAMNMYKQKCGVALFSFDLEMTLNP
jgi:hypothetical protein